MSIGKVCGYNRRNHYTAKEIIDKVGARAWQQAFRFAVVRNPWDKVVSQYKYRVMRNQTELAHANLSFDNWLACTYGPDKDPKYYNNPKYFLPQVEWLKNHEGQLDVPHIIRFEQLAAGWAEVAKALSLPTTLPHINNTTKTDYRTFYNDHTAQIVQEWFHEDIAEYNYTFD